MGKNILCFLIDDDEDDREIFKLALDELDNVQVDLAIANNGRDAIDQLNADLSFVPDFIFLDLNMPLMGGKQFLKEVKEHDHLADVPIIIYTTSKNDRDRIETLALGAREFIVKPSEVDALTKILSEILEPATVFTKK